MPALSFASSPLPLSMASSRKGFAWKSVDFSQVHHVSLLLNRHARFWNEHFKFWSQEVYTKHDISGCGFEHPIQTNLEVPLLVRWTETTQPSYFPDTLHIKDGNMNFRRKRHDSCCFSNNKTWVRQTILDRTCGIGHALAPKGRHATDTASWPNNMHYLPGPTF